ncbi:unnamed protein product [Prorocentrum cordatum]|uniref:S-adenosylmethionine synthetase C-terminal domain-containing protein n=1 Tax=Prorocentrum cordatum TaxID=2364126 RepID=A0ABN9WT82_9DINO|nr:unnamed protein product [Polarella glacialis]
MFFVPVGCSCATWGRVPLHVLQLGRALGRRDPRRCTPLDAGCLPVRAAHAIDPAPLEVEGDLMEQVVRPTLPEGLCDAKTQYSFPDYARVDAGLSGRRAVADTYGGWGSHGGAGLSGRDASRVSRCGAYAARCCRRPQGQGSSARFPPGP